MNKLSEKAAEIRKQNQNEFDSALEKERAEIEANESRILEEFKIAFADELPLLEEAGITFSAHQNTKYHHQGSYILFAKDGKELRMDFSHRRSYRYEYTGVSGWGTMVFADWGKDRFFLYIDENLLQ